MLSYVCRFGFELILLRILCSIGMFCFGSFFLKFWCVTSIQNLQHFGASSLVATFMPFCSFPYLLDWLDEGAKKSWKNLEGWNPNLQSDVDLLTRNAFCITVCIRFVDADWAVLYYHSITSFLKPNHSIPWQRLQEIEWCKSWHLINWIWYIWLSDWVRVKYCKAPTILCCLCHRGKHLSFCSSQFFWFRH